ncbi:hypothetical protein HGM15179_010962 [Zosterops borbonicus]|uniref:Uncharacterized protein n=1 Tax=Zosterops borbonicus TaxID=364589 RepID=A0A8K1GDI1_9PASS|nr:hypothetical protein HGM15179_010962 [Zosterops borbonicus]
MVYRQDPSICHLSRGSVEFWVCTILDPDIEKMELWQKGTAGYLGEETEWHLVTASFQAAVKSIKVSFEPPFLQAKQSQLPSAAPHMASSLDSPSVSLPFSGHNAAAYKFPHDDDVQSSTAFSKQKIKAYSRMLPSFLANLSLMRKRL